MAEKDERKIKMAIIAGASEAMKFKERNLRATDSEVLQHVTQRLRELVRNIELE